MSPLIRCTGLTFEIGGRRLLDDVTLEVPAGEVVALAGPNGAGKSTLLRLLSGELEASSGTIELDGCDLAGLRPADAARVRAVMPQETVLQFAFTVHEIVAMGRHPHRATASPDDDREAIAGALHETETQALEERTFPTLSGGEQSRVTLARVLAQRSPVLLLDEPVASLDLRHQQRAMHAARAVADGGGAVIAALHDLNLAAAHADRVALLHRGRLEDVGPPRHVLRAGLLEAVYEHPVDILESPSDGAPIVVPRTSPTAAAPPDTSETGWGPHASSIPAHARSVPSLASGPQR